MSPMFVLLGFVDVFAAALIFFPFSEQIVLYVTVYMIAKGGFFLLTGLASKSMDPFCMGLCVVDILTGVVLGAISFGIADSFTRTIGILSLLKGFYSLIVPIFS